MTHTTMLDLFAAPPARTLARTTDPQTSKAAAEKAVDTFVASHESKIFGAICDAGVLGATFKEIAKATNLDPVAVARRLGAMGKPERGVIKRRVTPAGTFESRDGCAVWFRS